MNFIVDLILRMKKTEVTFKALLIGLRWAAINTFFSWAFLHETYLDANPVAWAAVAAIDVALFVYSVFYLSPWEAKLEKQNATRQNSLRRD